MYDVFPDPYCYAGTTVLKNIPGLRTAEALEQFETAMTTLRSEEPMPLGAFDAPHYRAIHRHLFQDVYRWAGKLRTVRINRGQSHFCYPENIAHSLADLFGRLAENDFLRERDAADFAVDAAAVMAELNQIHAFRDGNGRAQLAFLVMLAQQAGHALSLHKMNEEAFLNAMIASFYGDEKPLSGEILQMVGE